MNTIYQVTVRGKKLESRDLRKLLARAVAEKKTMDERLRRFASLHKGTIPSPGIGFAPGVCTGDASVR